MRHAQVAPTRFHALGIENRGTKLVAVYRTRYMTRASTKPNVGCS
jgi:hypothetical protein